MKPSDKDKRTPHSPAIVAKAWGNTDANAAPSLMPSQHRRCWRYGNSNSHCLFFFTQRWQAKYKATCVLIANPWLLHRSMKTT